MHGPYASELFFVSNGDGFIISFPRYAALISPLSHLLHILRELLIGESTDKNGSAYLCMEFQVQASLGK